MYVQTVATERKREIEIKRKRDGEKETERKRGIEKKRQKDNKA